MATKKPTTQKVSFSKFFPEDDSFIKVNGSYDPKDTMSFEVDLTVQTGLRESINIFSYFNPNGEGAKNTMKQLKALQEATQKTIDFIESVQKTAKEKAPVVFDEKRVTKQRK